MPLSEIAGRSRQEAAKLIDRVTTADRALDPASDPARPCAGVRQRRGGARDSARSWRRRRFFAGVENLQFAAQAVAGHRDAVLSSAEATLQNRFDLLGYRTLWFGDPIDWHLDPVWSRRAPRVHWTQLNPLDPAEVGDSKVVWELNRHQWVAGLAQAYALSGDERYAESALGAIESWIDANPHGIGVNWSSSLEVAYRLMSWSWTLMLLRESARLSAERLAKILANVWLHARSRRAIPVVLLLAEHASDRRSARPVLRGHAVLRVQGRAALAPPRRSRADCREPARRSAPTACTSSARPATTATPSKPISSFCCSPRATACRCLQSSATTCGGWSTSCSPCDRPDGVLPEIGDADGGRLLPLVERAQCDPRGVFAVAAAMFGRGDFADAAEGMTPEVSVAHGRGRCARVRGRDARRSRPAWLRGCFRPVAMP